MYPFFRVIFISHCNEVSHALISLLICTAQGFKVLSDGTHTHTHTTLNQHFFDVDTYVMNSVPYFHGIHTCHCESKCHSEAWSRWAALLPMTEFGSHFVVNTKCYYFRGHL